MRRKPAIILFVLLLLLSVGGAGLHFQLRRYAAPELPEMKQFLHDIPPSSGWTLIRESEEMGAIPTGFEWLRRLGYRRFEKVKKHIYQFNDVSAHRLVNVTIFTKSSRIVHIHVTASPADATDFKRILLGKYSHLRTILK